MTGTEVAVQGQGTLALRGDQTDWLPAQRAALDQIGIGEAPAGDQQVFLHVCQRSGLDPFARQAYMISRWDPQSGKNKWTIQTGIDGYRVIAERRSEYGGQLEPQWCGDDGAWREVWTSKEPPVAARVGVIRRDWEHPVWGVAHFWEFAATKKDGQLNHMWATKGRHQIAKCAEAAALRKAFPQDFAGILVDEEAEHLDNPQPRMVIDAQREQPAEPDWDVLIAEAETARDRVKLAEVWKLARGLRPNDGGLLDRIAAAGERVKAATIPEVTAQPAEPAKQESVVAAAQPPAEKAEKKDKDRLFGLLRDGAVSSRDRELRLRITSRILNWPPTDPLTSFDQLTAAHVDTVNEFLQRHKDAGDLTHTLADLGATAADSNATPAEQPQDDQPEQSTETQGEQ